MDISLEGRHALVGGASRGIGRAAAEELALQGAAVTVIARTESALGEVVESLDTRHGQLHGLVAADSGDPQNLGNLIAELAGKKPVHILVNNTGGPPDGPVHTAALQEFIDAFTSHVLCSQALLQAVLPGMRASRYGRVINVISTSVKQPIPGLGVSNTIRGAMASWAKTLANELGPAGITVNNILPGFTETGRLTEVIAANAERAGVSAQVMADKMRNSVPLGRFGRTSETAAAIAFLASPAAAYINGVNLPVDGGRTGSL